MISTTVIMRGGEYKCRLVKMHLKVRYQQLKINIHICTYIHTYIYLMITTNQKSIIDIHTKKEKESKYNTKQSSNHKRREQKKKGTKKRYENNLKQ